MLVVDNGLFSVSEIPFLRSCFRIHPLDFSQSRCDLLFLKNNSYCISNTTFPIYIMVSIIIDVRTKYTLIYLQVTYVKLDNYFRIHPLDFSNIRCDLLFLKSKSYCVSNTTPFPAYIMFSINIDVRTNYTRIYLHVTDVKLDNSTIATFINKILPNTNFYTTT